MPYSHYSSNRSHRHGKTGYGESRHGIISRYHAMAIAFCAILLMGDFFTTTIALYIGTAETRDGILSFQEGNTLMSGIVTNPVLFLLSKVLILGIVMAAAYVLRDNGFMAFMPYIIVSGLYLFAVANNVSLLMAVF